MICERCGREIGEFHETHHEKTCVGRMEVQIKIRLSMIDPLRPQYAKTFAEYEHTRLPGAPCGDVLRVHYGTWNDAIRAMGFLPRDTRRKRGRVR